jgi:glycosyltransferase involved in cell wall biosynthesis
VYGGQLTVCRALIESSFSRDHDLLLLDTTQSSNPTPPLRRRIAPALRRFYHFVRLLMTERPDSVLLFSTVGFSLVEKGCMAWFARLRDLPVLVFPRGGEIIVQAEQSKISFAWNFLWLRGATHLLCQGPSWHHFAVERLGFTEERSPVVENWTATPALLRIGEHRFDKSSNEAPIVLFLAWLEEGKGVFDLLEVARQLSSSCSFKLVLAGRGHAEVKVRQFIETHQLAGCVELVGWLDQGAKEQMLARTDILVLPSWTEGFPNAIIEAMAAKVAVIVSAVGAVPSIVRDGEQALVIPPRNIPALRQAMQSLILNSELRQKLAARGHTFSKQRFSQERGAKRLTEIIRQAVRANMGGH